MIKRILISIFLCHAVYSAQAQQVSFVMSAPNAVEMGQQFRLTFTVNQRGSNLQLPPGLTGNFDVLMGPSTGQSTSIQTINGKTTTEVTFSYTYILRAKAEGSFEIRPATIEIDGKVTESNSLKIQVVPTQSQTQPQTQQSPAPGGEQKQGTQSADLGGDNLFLRVELSKTNVFRVSKLLQR